MGGPVKGRADHLELGSWNVACSMCGRKRKASELVKNWQGQWRCPEHNEPRHPQDFVRGVPDNMSVPFSQPEQDFDILICSFNGRSGFVGWAIAGCAIVGRTQIDPDMSY